MRFIEPVEVIQEPKTLHFSSIIFCARYRINRTFMRFMYEIITFVDGLVNTKLDCYQINTLIGFYSIFKCTNIHVSLCTPYCLVSTWGIKNVRGLFIGYASFNLPCLNPNCFSAKNLHASW